MWLHGSVVAGERLLHDLGIVWLEPGEFILLDVLMELLDKLIERVEVDKKVPSHDESLVLVRGRFMQLGKRGYVLPNAECKPQEACELRGRLCVLLSE